MELGVNVTVYWSWLPDETVLITHDGSANIEFTNPGTFSEPSTVPGGIFDTDRYSSANGEFLSYEVIIHWNACGQYGEPGSNNTPG